jgi:hypothetical protein
VVEFPSQTANMTKPYKNSGRLGDLLFEQAKFNVRRAASKRSILPLSSLSCLIIIQLWPE